MGKSGKRDIEQPAEGGVAAVDRAIAVLRAFDNGLSSLTLAEISARCGLYKSTVLRLIRSLEHGSLVTRLEDGRYRLGSEVLRLATIYQGGLLSRDIVLPHMTRIAEHFDESVGFYAPEGVDRRVCVYRINSSQTIAYNIRPGDVTELPIGSPGRVIAAFMGWQGKQYDDVRAEMIAFSQAERYADLASISAPVFGPDQRIAGALTLGGPKSRLDQAFFEKAAPTILEGAAELTRAVGGDARPILRALAERTATIRS